VLLAGAVGLNGVFFERARNSSSPILTHDNGGCVADGEYPGLVCQGQLVINKYACLTN